MWGRYIDRYSNKNVLYICAPIYTFCLLAWALTALVSSLAGIIALLVFINIGSGISTAGINLSLNNIGIKLAAKEQGMVYLTAKSMIIAAASATAPLLGGLLADSFSAWQRTLTGPLPHLHTYTWNIFFLVSAVFAMLAIKLLKRVKETGEVDKAVINLRLMADFRYHLREAPSRQMLRRIIYLPEKRKSAGHRKKSA
jgi:MFS family permease